MPYGNQGRGSAYYGNGWKTASAATDSPSEDWLVMCGTNERDVPAPGNVIVGQTEIGYANGGQGGCALHINNYNEQKSDFALYAVLIWNEGLTSAQMKTVTGELTTQLRGELRTRYEHAFTDGALLQLLAENPAHAAYYGGDYEAGYSRLKDLSGNIRHATVAGNDAQVLQTTGHGANKPVPALQGTTDTIVRFPELLIPETFTVCSATRWTSTANKNRILSCLSSYSVGNRNWLHGHHPVSGTLGGRGAVYYDAWKTRHYQRQSPSTDWVILCATNSPDIPSPSNVVYEQEEFGTSNGGTGSCSVHINDFARPYNSDFALHSMFVWDKGLTAPQMKTVTAALADMLRGPLRPDYSRVISSGRLLEFLASNPTTGSYFGKEVNVTAEGRMLMDLSGHSRHASVEGNGAEVRTSDGDGAHQAITFLQGTQDTKVKWAEMSVPTTFTVCSVTRWTSDLAAKKQRILSCLNAGETNWLHGHHPVSGTTIGRGSTYYGNGYKSNAVNDAPDTDWLILCGSNDRDVPSPGNVVFEQDEIGTSNAGIGACRMHINDYAAQKSDFALHTVLLWDQGLTAPQMKLVTEELRTMLTGEIRPEYERSISSGPFLELLASTQPYAVYYGEEYDARAGSLPDLSGNLRHAEVRGNGAEMRTSDGHGATQQISFLQGGTDAQIVWPDLIIPTTFTVCSVTRWTSSEAAKRQRILTCLNAGETNWLHGHHPRSDLVGGPGSAFYNGWKSQYDPERGADTDWVVLCGTNDASVSLPSNIIYEQVESGFYANGGVGQCRMHVNNYASQKSDFALHSVLIWDRGLSPAQMKTVTRELKAQLRGEIRPDYSDVIQSRALLDLLAETPPACAYYGSQYNRNTGRLPDLSGNARHATVRGNGVQLGEGPGDGANRDIRFLEGSTESIVEFPEMSVPATFTVCSVTRYTSSLDAQQKRVLSCLDSGKPNWAHGHMVAGRRGAAFYGTTAVSTPPADEPDTNWLVMCGTNDPSTQAPSNVIYEQNEIGTRNGGTGSCALHVNKYRALASPFALHSVLIWDKGLSPEQMKTVTRELQGQIQGTLQTDYEGVVSDPGLQQLLAQHPAHAVSPGPLSLRNELDTGR